MRNFFNLDSKFYKYGTILADMMILTLLWTITSLPLITVGASTTAMYYVTTREISHREGYVSKDFFRSFRQNFFQATGATIIYGIAIFILSVNIYALPASSILYPIQFVILAVVILQLVFVYPVLSRFKLKFFQLLATSFMWSIRHFFTSITCLALLAAIYFMVLRWPMSFLVCAGAYGFITSLMFMKIFRKYVPEMDTDKYDEMKRLGLVDGQNIDEAKTEEE